MTPVHAKGCAVKKSDLSNAEINVRDITQQCQAQLEIVQELFQEITQGDSARTLPCNPSELKDAEQEIHQVTNRLADMLAALQLQLAVLAIDLQQSKSTFCESPGDRLKSYGFRELQVRFAGGGKVGIFGHYYARNKPRAQKKKGIHLTLELLGVREKGTPMLLDNISHAATCSSSFEEAKDTLARQGVSVSVAKIQAVVRLMSRAARKLRTNDSELKALNLQGKTLVISTDGGRIRTRQKKRGRKTKKGRNRYNTPWREPKVICIYVVDKSGELPRIDRSLPVILDGTLGDANDVFTLIKMYLDQLKIEDSTRLLFIADGAKWIWDRVAKLRQQMKATGCTFIELLDFYHMSENLHKFASFKTDWTESQRKRWVKQMCKHLKTGKTEKFEADLRDQGRYARKGSEFRRTREYLLSRLATKHLDYASGISQGIPIGSGSIESTVRRVVNLRLKNASMFWLKENAEDLLVLRSFQKSGRHENIVKQGLLAIAG